MNLVGSPRFPPLSQPVLVAHHEAGHAVAAFAQDLPVLQVLLRVSEGGAEASGACPCMPEGLNVSASSPAMRDYWERVIAVFLAGSEAENLYRSKQRLSRAACPPDDQSMVEAIAGRLYEQADERESALQILQGRARRLVAVPAHWLAIERIAHSLQQRLPRWWIDQHLEAEIFLTGDEAAREFDTACAAHRRYNRDELLAEVRRREKGVWSRRSARHNGHNHS